MSDLLNESATPRVQLTPEQIAQHEREVMEHLSKRGMRITSSRQTPDGKWLHEAEFQPGTLIFSKVPQGQELNNSHVETIETSNRPSRDVQPRWYSLPHIVRRLRALWEHKV